MLVSYEVENFGALRDRATLDFSVPSTSDTPHTAGLFNHHLAHVAMLFGPNASGKTTLLDSMARLSDAVEHSHRSWDPTGGTNARPFLLRREALDHPTNWTVRFQSVDPLGTPGVYTYSVSMDTESVRAESLRFRSIETRRTSTVFRRTRQIVKSQLKGYGTLDRKMRGNSLLLSVAAQENEATALPAFAWLTREWIRARQLGAPETHQYALNSLIRAADLPLVRELVRRADLGIDDVRGHRLTEEQRAESRAAARRLQDALPGLTVTPPIGEFASLEFAHRSGDGADYYLPEALESDGTRAFLSAGMFAIRALQSGAVVILDELDGSLHPSLVDDLVGLFRSELTNPRGAQLIASSHDTHQFGRNALQPLTKHEVWFTEKAEDGTASLARLSEFEDVRPDVDQEHRYLAGRYGAVPSPHLYSTALLAEEARPA